MRWKWAIGIATIVFTIVAGIASFDYVNRRFPEKPAHLEQVAARATGKQADASPAPTPASQPTPDLAPEPAPTKPASACVERDGSWRNWRFPNVPMLSPKCEQ